MTKMEMILKVNLLGGAIGYIVDNFKSDRNYTVPQRFQGEMDIDVLLMEEEDLVDIANDDVMWKSFWSLFGQLHEEGEL